MDCTGRTICQVTVVAPFADDESLSTGEFRAVGPCSRVGSLAMEGVDAYGLVWEDAKITAHGPVDGRSDEDRRADLALLGLSD